jgi:hypothetical protein
VGWREPYRRADELLAGQYQYEGHQAVTLGLNPSWRENPRRDANWGFLHHSLNAVMSLLQAYASTGDQRYLDRAAFLLHDWHLSNPRFGAPSVWSWNDHSTALRAVVFSCAASWLPVRGWLHDALLLHGRVLADRSFYVGVGNHALNQSLGLLEVGFAMRRRDWRVLAADRINQLVARSIDDQGVTDEQAVGYQAYNYLRYSRALKRLRELGLGAAPGFGRIRSMPGLLAHATLPDGTYEMLGDTDRGAAAAIPGTIAEYAATQGRLGRRPGDTAAVYRAGYLFTRSGWGERRAFADETYLSLRWGAAPFIHGHADHGSVSLYGWGARLLVDPGKFTYDPNAWRRFFKDRRAHNVVVVDGSPWNDRASSPLLGKTRNATMVDATVRMNGNAGVVHQRHVTWSRRLHYTLVEDQLQSGTARVYRQLWHLAPDAAPLVRPTWFVTRRPRGNVQVRQLLNGSTSQVVTGGTSPIQGWVAARYGERQAAPVVLVARRGRNVRFLTLLVAAPGNPASSVRDLKLTPMGYTVVVTIGRKSERVTVNGTAASIVPLP